MQHVIQPLEPCPNCKTSAPCRVLPHSKRHSGYECTECDENRWGGITLPTGSRVVGYLFRDGAVCFRCARKSTKRPGEYPSISYLNGGIAPIHGALGPGEVHDRHCEECGVLIDNNC